MDTGLPEKAPRHGSVQLGKEKVRTSSTATIFRNSVDEGQGAELSDKHRRDDAMERHNQTAEEPSKDAKETTFFKSMQISLHEPVGSMSLSPANRDVVLGARKGLFIIDLENPYDQPRFLAHLTTWEVADIQWNPHPARAHWVASTSNQKLLVWNLDRPSSARSYINRSATSLSGADSLTQPSARPSLGDRQSTFSRVSAGGTSQPSGCRASYPLQSGGGSIQLKSKYTHRTGSITTGGESSFYPSRCGGVHMTVQRRLSPISHVLQNHTRAITDINWSAFNPDVLASCGIDTWTWIWDLRMSSSDAQGGTSLSGKPVQGYSAWNASATQVKYNRASPHRLATAVDNKVLIWDERKGSLPLATIEAHESRIYGIDWSRDMGVGLDRLITCSLDGSVKFWNLASEHAQGAIGRRELITGPEGVIETPTPVWRARHLPFGEGVMTLPQRGDNALSMWSKEEAYQQERRREAGETDDSEIQPVTRFEGHTDIVKEYLFRTRGGTDRAYDDRQFQLITWSKDQTLRLWPVSEQITKAVGHKPGSAIRIRFTRNNARDISFRVPRIEHDHDLLPSSNIMSDYGPGISSPVLSSGANSQDVRSSCASLPASANSARNATPLQVAHSPFGPSSHHSAGFHAPAHFTKGILRSAKTLSSIKLPPSMTSHEPASGQAPMTGVKLATGARSGTSKRRTTRELLAKDAARSRTSEHEWQQAASKTTGFMTVNGVRQGPFRFHRSQAAAADPLDWIARVKMQGEGEDAPAKNTLREEDDPSEMDGSVMEYAGGGESAARKKGAHSLSDEIMGLSKRLPRVIFEKVEIAQRNCVIALYGPWASREPAFVRINFSFPTNYPDTPLHYDLERSAKIVLKTRAFLLRNLASITSEQAREGQPSMEACVRFLLGETLSSDPTTSAQRPPELGDDEGSSEEDEPIYQTPQLLPVRCGASFGMQGQLVVFSPTTMQPWLRDVSSRDASRQRSRSRQGQPANSTSSRPSRSAAAPTDRFLTSYDALSNAMTRLAEKSNEGQRTMQALDVLQLMSSDFISRRSEQQQQARTGASRREKSLGKAVLPALQTPSQEPDHKDTAVASTGYLTSLQTLHTQTWQVQIYDVSHIVPTPRTAFSRRRSSSLPFSMSIPSRPNSLSLSLSGELPSPTVTVRHPHSPMLGPLSPVGSDGTASGVQKSKSIIGLQSFFTQ
ncbi:WD40 repeat-like protein [Tilletiaria anomala UBC 951]|uniref:WD40 repeat-like protein n=1 Tax=Tilletiaria anomala (strain ATCC 24038 / CBS 436.72 / UBC 951) TaxID=1037660 RepID=A0A066VZH9_TILAU|nr:WD40 repeat-like protein [Tilletiaria anomala UBC 951]KDN47142.1 WD40 repeat-like protein [Tilletiaria anomala UBC 951]